MRKLVRQQVALPQLVVPVGEIAAADAVFRAAVMLQPDPAQVVGDGEQEVVMVVMLASERLHRLFDQSLVRRNLLGLSIELGRCVGDDIEGDVRRQRECADGARRR